MCYNERIVHKKMKYNLKHILKVKCYRAKKKENSFITIKQYYFKQKHCLKKDIFKYGQNLCTIP